VQANEEKASKWQLNFEDIEAKKFVEVHSAMKLLNGNFQKVATDNKDRFEILQQEVSTLDSALRSQISDLKNKLLVDAQTIEERCQMLIETVYHKLRADNFTGSPGSGEGAQGTVSSERVDLLREELKQHVERICMQTTERVIESKHQSDLLLEGRANAFSVDLERKFKEQLKIF